jgi:hypothetical protein
MNERTHLLAGLVAGLGVFLIEIWPVALVWWAGASGSVGDFSELRFFGVSLIYSAAVATGAGIVMIRALRWAERTAGVGRFDPWGAYAIAIGVYNLALTAVPAIMYGLLLVDENKALRDRELLAYGLWVGGNVVAVAIALLAGRVLLGGRRVGATTPTP